MDYNFKPFPVKSNAIFCVLLVMSFLPARAQLKQLTEKISLHVSQSTAQKVIEETDRQSRYAFLFAPEQISTVMVDNFEVKAQPLGEVLNLLQKKYGLVFSIVEENISVKPGPVEKAAPAPKQGPGKLEGKIVDEENSQPVLGATVRIGNKGVTSDENGFFSISLPKGRYNAEISFIGYGTKKVTDIFIKEDESFTLHVPLKRDKGQLGTVTVSARRIRETGTINAIVHEIRDADAVVSGISKEQIIRSQDRDAAEVVKRIPGVSVIQNRFIVIRGLPQRYNSVMLNNVMAPSFESDSRAFSFDIMPSSMIDRVMIYKTAIPELPGDFAGGVVKVYTTTIPAKNYLNISYQASFRPNTTFQDFYEQPSGKYSWLGYDDGTYTLPSGYGKNKRIDQLSTAEKKELAKKFNNNWDAEKKRASPDHRFGIDFGRRISLSNKVRMGVTGGFNYTNTSQYTITSRNIGVYGNQGSFYAPAYTFFDERYDHNVRVNGLLNVSLDINSKHRIDIKNLYTHMGGTSYIYRTGETGAAASDGSGLYNDQYVRQSILGNTFRGIYTGQIAGSHELTPTTHMEWVAGYTKSKNHDPDQRTRTSTSSASAYYNDSAWHESLGTNLSYLDKGRRYFLLPEENKTFGLDLVQHINIGRFSPALKAGVFIEKKNRSFEFRQLGHVTLDGSVVVTESFGNTNSYTAGNNLKAGYLAADIPLSGRLKLYGGLRVEDNRQELFTYSNATAGGPVGEIHIDKQNTSLLPSVSLNYSLTDKSQLRAVYAKTLNRPEFREIAEFFFLDLDNYSLAFGNSNLATQTDIHNFDLRFEHYPGEGEMFSASLFYKHFKNPLEFYFYNGSSGRNNFQWDNAKSATNYGAEIEMMIGLGRYFKNAGVVKNLSLLLNAAYIFSEVDLGDSGGLTGVIQDKKRPLYGQSPYLVNTAVNYTNDSIGLQLNVSYNVIGRRIVAIGNIDSPNRMEMPRHALDVTFSQRISKVLEIKGGVQNILNARFMQMQDMNKDGKFNSLDNRYESHYDGTYYSLGFGVRL